MTSDQKQTMLQDLEDQLEGLKATLFDYPKQVGRPLGEAWWVDQAKGSFAFNLKLMSTIRLLCDKIEKLSRKGI